MLDNEQNEQTVAQDVQGANTENSPASGANQVSEQPVNGAVNSNTDKIPFDKRPEAREFMERQRKVWDRDWSKRLEETQATYEKRLQEMQAQFQQSSNNTALSDQDRVQLRQLAKLMKSDPEVLKELGLADIGSLKEQFERFNSMTSEQAVSQEAEKVVSGYAEKFGYQPKELEREIWAYIAEDDYWGNQPMGKGVFTKAARDYMADRSQELAERAANMKLVNQNREKQKAGSQKPVGTAQNTPQKAPTSFREAIRQSIARHKDDGVSV